MHPHAQAFLLPHEMFAAIYHNYPEIWRTSISPDVTKLVEFWNAQTGHPQMQGHPVKSRPGWKSKAVPIAFHGDGVPVTGIGKIWSKTMTMFHFTSLLSQGHSKEVMFWIWSVFDRLRVKGDSNGEGTLESFFRILRWSLYSLYEGVWPDSPWDSDEKQTISSWSYMLLCFVHCL